MEKYAVPQYDTSSTEESLSTQVYKKIKNKILDLSYPPGSFLTEAKLSEEYSVSRMPIRIAIQKLSCEGWLLSDFRRKLRVKDIDKKIIKDIYQLREILETRALQKIFEDDLTWKFSFVTEEKLLKMKAARDNYYEYLCADAEFHFALISVFENDRIEQMYNTVCDEVIRICLLLYQRVTEHEDYVPTIIDGMEQLAINMREKNYEKAYYYLRRDHFDHSVGGVSVADIVDELMRAQNRK
ncbi:GntR family transcriptional regulator [Bacilliculturomica massiliensis]|uniref:GntR family transcriptional regulator n=1 Tax=Bacilliculturomica massiliensis TaxID=1917867 RepID=UPI001030C31C|nr:GntR family transcriptional regulator [Bacilliculturomica massiliensis]